MSNAQHTPGPWAIRRFSWPTEVTGPIHQVISCDNFPTAFVPAWDKPAPGEVGAAEESRANAHLIAAAPELLEALRAIYDRHNADTMAQARAAIAKATGGQA